MKKFWSVIKTAITGVVGGAAGAVLDTAMRGQIEPVSLKNAAIIGAVGAIGGLWVEKPNVSAAKPQEGK